MATGECLAHSGLQADSNVKFAAWTKSWWSPGADCISHRRPKVNSRIQLHAVDNSAINIVLCIIALYCYCV